jgi:hypothetical protein
MGHDAATACTTAARVPVVTEFVGSKGQARSFRRVHKFYDDGGT